MTEITQAARDFAADFWANYAGTRTEFSRKVRRGENNGHGLVQAFQRAIDLGRAQALEEAAKVAINHSNYGHVEGNTRAFVIAADIERRAAAIRALKDRDAGDVP
jgi:hypothetical protein